MLTIAAQMFIAAWLSTPYAARSYFFVTFSSTKDASSVDEQRRQPSGQKQAKRKNTSIEDASFVEENVTKKKGLDKRSLFGTKKTPIELNLVSKCAE
ncbi:hypothetical protein T08_8430 [Trichinella sp. T8]|nr:hypothetical protein T08_8430 [Trichinella sp. T8]